MSIRKILGLVVGIAALPVLMTAILVVKNIELRDGLLVSRGQANIIDIPKTVQDMIANSDLIVIGRPLQSFNETTPDIDRLNTGAIASAHSPTLFKVNRVLKGNVDGDTITIGENFAIVSDTPSSRPYVWAIEDYQPLVKDKKYLLFLGRGMRTPKYYISGVYFGKMNLDGLDNSETQIQDPQFQAIRAAAIQQFQQIADQTP